MLRPTYPIATDQCYPPTSVPFLPNHFPFLLAPPPVREKQPDNNNNPIDLITFPVASPLHTPSQRINVIRPHLFHFFPIIFHFFMPTPYRRSNRMPQQPHGFNILSGCFAPTSPIATDDCIHMSGRIPNHPRYSPCGIISNFIFPVRAKQTDNNNTHMDLIPSPFASPQRRNNSTMDISHR